MNLSTLISSNDNNFFDIDFLNILLGHETLLITKSFIFQIETSNNINEINNKCENRFNFDFFEKFDCIKNKIEKINNYFNLKEEFSGFISIIFALQTFSLSPILFSEEFNEIISKIQTFNPNSHSINELFHAITIISPLLNENLYFFIKQMNSNPFYSFIYFQCLIQHENISLELAIENINKIIINASKWINISFFKEMIVDDFIFHIFNPLSIQIPSFLESFDRFLLEKLFSSYYFDILHQELTNNQKMEIQLLFRISSSLYAVYHVKKWYEYYLKNPNEFISIFPLEYLENDMGLKKMFQVFGNLEDFHSIKFIDLLDQNYPVQIHENCERIFFEFFMGISALYENIDQNENWKPGARLLNIIINDDELGISYTKKLRNHFTNSYLTFQEKEGLRALWQVSDFLKTIDIKSAKATSSLIYRIFNLFKSLPSRLSDIETFSYNMKIFYDSSLYIYDLLNKDQISIPEFEVVIKSLSLRYSWHISLKNGIYLTPPGDIFDSIDTIKYNKLKLATAKLNLTRNGFSEIDSIKINKFLKIFHALEVFKLTLSQLKNYYILNIQEFVFDIDENDSITLTTISTIQNQQIEIDDQLFIYYTNSNNQLVHAISKEHLCLSFNYINKKEYHLVHNILFSSFFSSEESVIDFCKKLNINLSFMEFLNCFQNFIKNISFDLQMKRYFNNKNSILVDDTRFDKDIKTRLLIPIRFDLYSKLIYGIFYIIFKFQDSIPFPKQLLICSKNISPQNVLSFFDFFRESNKPIPKDLIINRYTLFFIINSEDLNPESFDVLNEQINLTRSYYTGFSRLILLSTSNEKFLRVSRVLLTHFRIIDFSSVFQSKSFNTSFLSNYFFTYNELPRCGKSQTIFKRIYQIGSHIYLKIIVDKNTKLKTIISKLNSIPEFIKQPVCYHFDIDGDIGPSFCLYILYLSIFRILSDDINIPYILKPNHVFFFEFGSFNSNSKQYFIDNIFPIGGLMSQLDVEPINSSFSFHEYIIEKSQIEGLFQINFTPNNRYYLAVAFSFQKIFLENKTKKLSDKNFNDFQVEFLLNINSAFLDPINSYNVLTSIFDQQWIKSYYKNLKPLISNIVDVSKFINQYRDIVLNELTFYNEYDCSFKHPIRYNFIELLIEQAILTNGINFNPNVSNLPIQSEVNNLSMINSHIKLSNRFCFIDKDYLLILYNSNVKKKDIPKFHSYLENVITYNEWEKIQFNNYNLFSILDKMLRLVEKNTEITRPYRSFIIYNSLNENQKGVIRKIWKNGILITFLATASVGNNLISNYNDLPINIKYFFEDVEFIVKYHPTHSLIINSYSQTSWWKSPDLFIKEMDIITSNSMLRKYSLSLHNIQLIIQMIYRLNSGVPFLLIGETGSGKTYSVDFLAEIYGDHSILKKFVVDGGTTEKNIHDYINNSILQFQTIRKQNQFLILFFDEVNTTSCQWFLKSIIIDRYIDNIPIPDFVKFICTANPVRFCPPSFQTRLKSLDQGNSTIDSNKIDLVYKVNKIPLSMYIYFFPADPPRNFIGEINGIDNYSEFELMISKVFKVSLSVPTQNNLLPGEHFCNLSFYSQSFDQEFYQSNFPDISQAKYKIETLISNILVYAYRLMIDEKNGFFKDPSIISIREAEHCSRLMRFFYKFGLFDPFDDKKSKEELQLRFLYSFILSFTIIFSFKLSSYKKNEGEYSDRNLFLLKIIYFWDLIKLPNVFFPPKTISDWNLILSMECQKYSNIFVDDHLNLAKNSSLSENIWVTFISMMTNLPLWIIGLPGTSKSLAVNLVFQKLSSNRFGHPKFRKLPALIKQTFMCSELSRPEALLSQFERIAEKASEIGNSSDRLPVLLLEEIGHADLSPYAPLKCLNRIIDTGYLLSSGESVQIMVIGLSNYKIDSAKLNRGILIVRDELNRTEKETTAFQIFSLTSKSYFSNKMDPDLLEKQIQQYYKIIKNCSNNYEECLFLLPRYQDRHFFGLRDFYGMIRSISTFQLNDRLLSISRNFSGLQNSSSAFFETFCSVFNINYQNIYFNPLQVIESNLQSKWNNLTIPLYRHLLIPTKHYSSSNILLPILKKLNQKIEFFFSDNSSGLPDEEWIMNDLKRFADSLSSGDIVLFYGHHPCLEGLYDVFNLMYEEIGGKSITLLSFGGDSYTVQVHKNFKTIIMLDYHHYLNLPLPFLNRFEKIPLDYSNIITKEDIIFSKNLMDKFIQIFKPIPLRKIFSLYDDHYFFALVFLSKTFTFSIEEILSFALLNVSPSTIIWISLKYKKFYNHFKEFSILQTSISSLIKFYQENLNSDNKILNLIYNNWKSLKGISVIVNVPYLEDFSKLEIYSKLIIIDLTPNLIIDNLSKQLNNYINENLIIIITLKRNFSNVHQKLTHIQFYLTEFKNSLNLKDNFFHIFIVLNSNIPILNLHRVQTLDWPVIQLDYCIEKKLCFNDLSSISINQLLYFSFNDLIQISNFNFNFFYDYLFKELINSYNLEIQETILNYLNIFPFKEIIKECLIKIIGFIPTLNEPMNFILNEIKLLISPPFSLIDFIIIKLNNRFLNILKYLLSLLISYFNINFLDLENFKKLNFFIL